MSLLTMIQDAAVQCSLPVPSFVVSNTNETVRQLLRLAQIEGQTLARRRNWQALTREQTFLSVASIPQPSGIPDDFDRILSETFFNRSTKRQVFGPLSPSEWQLKQASLITFVNPSYRIIGSVMQITPIPADGHTFAYEYITKNWCLSSGGGGRAAWGADDDRGLLSEEIMTLGVAWRFKKVKRLQYEDVQADYERRVLDAMQADGTLERIVTDVPTYDRIPHAPILPDGVTIL